MSDVRALLKAKRQEARVFHPLAVYSESGQLRCTACTTNVKHTSAWEGHIGSKVHRTNMARLKDEERHNEAWKEEPRVQGKRKIEEKDHHPDDEESKRPKVGTETTGTGDSGLFPTDFFSDPSQGPLPPTSDNSDDEGAMARSHIAPANHEASVLDLEWEKFQRDVLNESDHRETYERATVFAEPIIVAETQEEGFPKHQSKDTEPVQVNDEEARRKREQDDRELIMDRLLDEERAQEEADLKVVVIKGRLDALKERRQAAKAAKSK